MNLKLLSEPLKTVRVKIRERICICTTLELNNEVEALRQALEKNKIEMKFNDYFDEGEQTEIILKRQTVELPVGELARIAAALDLNITRGILGSFELTR